MTPYNMAHGLYKARQADHTTVADPGDAGVINVSPTDLNVCIVTGGTTRDLQDASEVPVGVQLLLISQTSTITVSGVALGDGEFALYIVTLDASAAHQWSVVTSADISANVVTRSAAAAAGDLVLVSGGADRSAADPTPIDLGTVNINTGDAATDAAIIALADALAGFGLVEHVWT